MKHLPLLLIAGISVTSFAAQHAARAASDTAQVSADPKAHYDTRLFQGHWSVMAIPPVITTVDNSAGSDGTRLQVVLSDSLKKITGQNHFSLKRESGSTWSARQGALKVAFSLVSENSALLHIDGAGEKQHLEMFLYRED